MSKNHSPGIVKFSVHVTCNHGSVVM